MKVNDIMGKNKVCVEEIENGFVVTLIDKLENSQKYFQTTLQKALVDVRGFLTDCNYVACAYDKEEVQRIIEEEIGPMKEIKLASKLASTIKNREKAQEEYEKKETKRTRCFMCLDVKDDVKERINESTMIKQKYNAMCDECWEKTLISIDDRVEEPSEAQDPQSQI